MKFIRYSLLLIIFTCSVTEAQYYAVFGRNKVQYEDFNWKIIKTTHFDIYYYNNLYEIAKIGASLAESTYTEYQSKFATVINRRIPLILYNTSLQFQQTNTIPGFIPDAVGGFFEFIKGRVVIPFTGSLHDFKHVIRHELAHVFMTSKAQQVLNDYRSSSGSFPPLWFTEGFAEYISTKVDAQAEMVMRDALFHNYFVNLEDIYKVSGTFQMYKEGQSFLEFVKEKYGHEKVMQMIDNIWMYRKFSDVVAYTLGKKIEEIDKEWVYYLKEKNYPLYRDKTPINIKAKNITDFGFNFSPVPYTVDGITYLYFAANRDGYSSLYRVKIDTTNDELNKPELVIRGEKSSEYETFHLFRTAIDVSKKGVIAFVTKQGGTDVIHFYSIKEEKIIKDYKNNDLISITSPKFSSDGSEVVFQAVDNKGFSDIFIYNINRDKLDRLTNDYYDDKDPAFGINDDQIIFVSDRTSGKYKKKYNIFSFNKETHKIEYVTYINANCSTPVLNKEKTRLVFTSDMDSVDNIYVMNIINGKYQSKITRITNFFTSVYTPNFFNSNEIVFAGFEDYKFDLYTINYKNQINDNSFIATMNFDSTGSKWVQTQLKPAPGKEKLKYKRQYTLDYAQSQISTDPLFGTQGGAIFSLSDLLGDDNYVFTIYNSAQTQSEFLNSFNLVLSRIDLSKRTNYSYGIFHFTGNRYDIRESNEYFFERVFGGFFVLNFPLSKFARLEASTTVANSDKEVDGSVINRKALLVSNSISYVYDNSLWLPTGPIDGTRARLLLGYTGDVKFNNVNYYSIIADYRHYFRLGLRSALAVRAGLFFNDGKEARRYFMGGSWDLRGWPRFSIRGEKMWLTSVELRFPLIDQLNLRLPFLNLGFWGFRGALYFDSGSAWDTKYKETLGSVGGGIRFSLFGAIVLRYDIGKKIEDNFSRFQDGLFYQFFFGYDF